MQTDPPEGTKRRARAEKAGEFRYTKGMKSLRFLFCLLALGICGTGGPLAAHEAAVNLAFLPLENLDGDPRQEYLKGIIASILEEDLENSGRLHLVERGILDEILREQKLRLSGLTEEENSLEAGRLLGVTHILKGQYVFLGEEVFIRLSLVNVETGRSRSFSQRGSQENTVHALSEELLRALGGKGDAPLQTPEGERSILAAGALKPGRVELFSRLSEAEVYLNEEFSGYTTGEETRPLVLELPPGEYTLRIHLTRDFGVVQLPEIRFSDWQESFTLRTGERLVLTDQTAHFNEILYKLRELAREEIRLHPQDESEEPRRSLNRSIRFTDRKGRERQIELSFLWEALSTPQKGGRAVIRVLLDGEEQVFRYFVPEGEETAFREDLGPIRLDTDLECRSRWNWDLEYRLLRTDVYQGMHRAEQPD